MGVKEVEESVARGHRRLVDGEHDGVDDHEVRDLAVIPPANAMEPFTPVRQALFLQALARKPIVGRAAKAAGMTTAGVYALRKRSPAFAAAWDEALCAGVDDLEECAIDRAKEKSDPLMALLLKGMRPETYRERVDLAIAARTDIVVDLVPFVKVEEVLVDSGE